MTTLIGCRCKSGNIFSRALLIGRGLFLKKVIQDESASLYHYAISSVLAKRIRWWQIVRKPPVPIPNTVVKTLSGENTWRATSWKDSSLPTSKLNNYVEILLYAPLPLTSFCFAKFPFVLLRASSSFGLRPHSTQISIRKSPRPISNAWLKMLPLLHLHPINVVIYNGTY